MLSAQVFLNGVIGTAMDAITRPINTRLSVLLVAVVVGLLQTLPAKGQVSSVRGSANPDPPVTVDQARPMTGGFAKEWNIAGNPEGCTLSQATGTVSGGILRGTPTGTDPAVVLSDFPSGPDLDLGWNDFLELRIAVPRSYAGPIQISYGTTLTSGFAASRVFTIPASVIPRDGKFHTYRLDLGLEVFWRGMLRDLRIDPVDGASGTAFAIDYFRIGDEPEPVVYKMRETVQCPAPDGKTPPGAEFGAGQKVLSLESKRFRILWNAGVEKHGGWNANIPRGTLRNLEEVWQVFVKKLGYTPPNQVIGNPAATPKYKLNVLTYYGGYWAGVDEGFAHMNVTPDGLRVDPPSGVLPHEGMHCFQFHTTSGHVPSEWFEFHANYARELYTEHYRALFPGASDINPNYVRCAHQTIEDGRHYYLSWPMLMYLDENPDALPDLGPGTVANIWRQTKESEFSLMALERLTPTTSLKDIAGYFARRGATYDYKNQATIKAVLVGFDPPLDNAATSRWQISELVQRPDDPSWWRVPFEMAPMQGGYAIHELVPGGSGAGRVVSVNLRGLPDAARGADWRASFIVVADNGTERYSSLWGSGKNSVTLSAAENKLYVSVAGAPAVFHYGGTDDVKFPYRSHPAKTRFPYELQVTGATPKQRDHGSPSGLTQHPNGGGYRSVNVPASVYIGPNARVLGGTVSGNARIEDYALVSGGTVSGNAIVSGHAWVRGGTVTGNAKIRDWALIEERATITGNARVFEHANIKGGTVQDIATAKGTAGSLGGTVSGNAIIDGNYGDFFSGRNVANGVAFGHVPYVGVPDSHIRPLPGGLYASYDFATAHDSRIVDNPGVTDGFTVGAPVWTSADMKRKGFLAFDGATQHVNLDRSVADFREWTFSAWVKPLGGAANQALLWAGASATKRLYFTPADGAGKAKFSIVDGGTEQTLTASSALPNGAWSHVVVTLNGTNGAFYINGKTAATGAITLRADQVLPANTATTLQHIYLARSEDNLVPKFRGALDDVQFSGKALAPSEVAGP
ncbi:MAG: DUF6055 domain-containing protein [Verrucomicrobiota bacterium]